MQFKHPELLYALLLLLIPILIHLFQLRKFKKEAFTNVAFLKKVTMQTRKSSQIKKWIVLLTRLGILAAIVLAFAQPFTTKNKSFNSKTETVIYLDNSFSMQVKGDKGELLKRAAQDIITNIPADENITLITNDDIFRNTTINSITNDLVQLKYSSNQMSYDAVQLKSKKYFSKNSSSNKNLVIISDFQQNNETFKIEKDSTITTHLVQLDPINTNNITIDSLYISKRNASNIEITVTLKNNGEPVENLPISLFSDGNLLLKSAVEIDDQASTIFTLPNNEIINGSISIDDTGLQFDNSLFFNINESPKINVLTIKETEDSFLKRIYTSDEFNYTASRIKQLDYNAISDQNLIILNELKSIPNSLNTALKSFTDNGGSLIIIPSEEIDLKSYNNTLLNYNISPFSSIAKFEKRLTTINYAHPLYSNGVFEKQVKNFQYPKVSSYYPQKLNSASAVLQFEDGKPFLSQRLNTYVFTSALNKNNSNFRDINLIVPTFYNIGKRSLQLSKLFYNIGKTNTFAVPADLKQDEILSLVNGNDNLIPRQQYFKNKVVITTDETPSKAGIYNIKNKSEIIENVSYNFNRSESKLVYYDVATVQNALQTNSISELFDTLKSDSKVNALWKWFIIFALILLIIEMLILKYFK